MYHSFESWGRFVPKKLAHKVLEYEFCWPTIFSDTYEFYKRYKVCQKIGNLLRRNQMSLHDRHACEIFDVSGVDFIRPFPPSFALLAFLMLVD